MDNKTEIHISPISASKKVVFMSGLHNEVVGLLYEAQDYFSDFGEEDQAGMDMHMRAIYSCEMSRITMRLSCIMAWLLAQKAAINHNYPKESIACNWLEFRDFCLVDSRVLHGILPSYMCYLLDSSLEMYERALRLGDAESRVLH